MISNLPRFHSARVRLTLITSEETYSLAQIGPDLIIFSKPVSLEPCDGEVLMEVDGAQRRWQVRLPEGALSTRARTPTIDR